MKILMTLLIFTNLLIISGFFLKSLILEYMRWPLFFIAIIFILLVLNRIIQLRVFHFENTGVVFSIKYYHPIRQGAIFPYIDYPVNRLKTFKIEKSFLANNIVIEVDSKRKEKPLRIRVKVSDITDKDYHRMTQSFT